jgi:hypothetical protein
VGILVRLVAAVRAGQSQVLVVRGEPGVGKTALLDYLAGEAQGCRVVRAAGMQSEMELAFAGLHQLPLRRGEFALSVVFRPPVFRGVLMVVGHPRRYSPQMTRDHLWPALDTASVRAVT